MTVTPTSRSAAQVDRNSRHSVIVDAGPGHGLVALPRRRRDDVLARLRAGSLDARLAAGEAPETGRLLAVRAAQITGPSARGRVARDWDDVIARARRAQMPYDPHAPVSRSQVAAAVREIGLVAGILRARRPVSAHGVALAATLLTVPDSPVYRRCHDDGALAAALTRAAERM